MKRKRVLLILGCLAVVLLAGYVTLKKKRGRESLFGLLPVAPDSGSQGMATVL